MILLKVKTPGLLVSIPGLPVFRTPAEVDVSKVDIRIVHMYLTTAGVEEYEIVAESKHGDKEVYKREDFDDEKSNPKDKKNGNLDKRLENLELLMTKLLEKERNDKSVDSEQITNKLSNLEKLVTVFSKEPSKDSKKSDSIPTNKEPVIEELDSFIPDIDISDMTIKAKVKTMKKDGMLISDNADILSNIVKKGKKND